MDFEKVVFDEVRNPNHPEQVTYPGPIFSKNES